ncbi:hypothetical protein VTJ49DRAFT_6399 [Mycothermus thermophilus]|uniref:Uncharacterized protein n=1 Tax=Humicola insolens TaxID=85995 RepID=A0ABR3VQA8_HUMIN
MDLRGMLNDNGPSTSTPSKPAPPPPPPQLHPSQHPPPQAIPPPSLPSTPIQTASQQSFRDYGQTQPSPSRPLSQDYGAHRITPAPFASSPPPPYPGPGAGAGPGPGPAPSPYSSRPPPPPPLQQLRPADVRPPTVGPAQAHSPYQQTPTAPVPNAGGYPFPSQQQTTSPVQRHQYPPPNNPFRRDSYPPPTATAGPTPPPPIASPHARIGSSLSATGPFRPIYADSDVRTQPTRAVCKFRPRQSSFNSPFTPTTGPVPASALAAANSGRRTTAFCSTSTIAKHRLQPTVKSIPATRSGTTESSINSSGLAAFAASAASESAIPTGQQAKRSGVTRSRSKQDATTPGRHSGSKP